jgi:hypothetical protein
MPARILLRAGGAPLDLSAVAPAPAPPQEAVPVSLDDRIRDLEANLAIDARRSHQSLRPRERSDHRP